jgi:hypothetical protein
MDDSWSEKNIDLIEGNNSTAKHSNKQLIYRARILAYSIYSDRHRSAQCCCMAPIVVHWQQQAGMPMLSSLD